MTEAKDPKENKSSKEEKTNIQKKLNETLEKIKKPENIDRITEYARNNIRDTVAFVVLFIGILFSFFSVFMGGSLIGIVVGIYFADDIIHMLGNINHLIESLHLNRSLILLGAIVGFFILVPMFFIAGALAVAIKFIISSGK